MKFRYASLLCICGQLLALLVACSEDLPQAEIPSAGAELPQRWQEAGADLMHPPYARWESDQSLREDLARPRAAADGAGRAWIEAAQGELPSVRVGESLSLVLIYEAGPLGIAEGGALYFMPNPFWGWSSPQALEPAALGYTTATSPAPGLSLESESLQGMLAIFVRGRALAEGEQVRIHYGAGAAGARVDRHAEREEHLWIGVDGDADGVRAMLVDSPRINVLAGPPERLVLHAQSRVRCGARLRLSLAVLDGWANAGVEFSGKIQLSGAPPDWQLPQVVELSATDRACKTLEILAASPGTLRLQARAVLQGEEVLAESNPIWVSDDATPVCWGDLHGHSQWTDGTGTVEDYFRYARDVAALDVAALSDHDHWGVLFLDQHPNLWQHIIDVVAQYYEPGRFTSLLAYEWTSWVHGHRHVVYFEESGQVYSSLDPESSTPRQLWDKLRGQAALTFAHHSAGNPIPTNWSFAPDPELEPLTEVMSVHGSSEALDCPSRLSGGIPGNFVRDVLDHGYRLGFLGSGDGHDGHPGLAHLSPVYRWAKGRDGRESMGTGGLAGILATDNTRAAVLAALQARRVWATSGPRILLQLSLGGQEMGAALRASELSNPAPLHFRISATQTVERVEMVRSGELITLSGIEPESRDIDGLLELADLKPGEYLYLRVVQSDRAMAWSSPYFFD